MMDRSDSCKRSVIGLAVAAVLLISVAPAEAAKPDKRRAKRHAKNATRYFKAESYQRALDEFEAAYRLYPVPALLYNMGQCHLFLKRHQEAVDAFEQFLSEKPDTPYRADVEKLIGEAKRELEAKRQAEEQQEMPPPELPEEATPPIDSAVPEVTPPPPPPPPAPQIAPPPPADLQEEDGDPVYTEWWFWTIIGGVALAAGGTAVAVTAGNRTTTVLPMGDLGVLDRR